MKVNSVLCVKRGRVHRGNFESMFVEIQNTSLDKAIIGIVYHPPDNIRLDDFHEYIQHILHIIISYHYK